MSHSTRQVLQLRIQFCPRCGKAVPSLHDRFQGRREFCSPQCFNAHRKEANAKYAKARRFGSDWHLVLVRDNHQCTVCEATDTLLIHHKDGSGRTPHVNNDLANLQTVCRNCHHSVIHRKAFRQHDKEQLIVLFGQGKPIRHIAQELQADATAVRRWARAYGLLPRKLASRSCPVCGKEFMPAVVYQRNCSKECSDSKRKADYSDRRRHGLVKSRKGG